jgi:hypothetical protein
MPRVNVAAAEKNLRARSYSQKTLKTLFTLSGNKCAEETCTERVIRPARAGADVHVVGEIAHIYASSDTGPRGKRGLTPAARDRASNLVALCPTHHGDVDGQHQRFPSETLLQWKAAQEAKVSRDLHRSVNDVGYAELEVDARAVAAATADPSASDYTVVPPAKKLYRNRLGPKVALLLTMGAAKSHEVEQVPIKAPQLDPDMPRRMTSGFVAHYEKHTRARTHASAVRRSRIAASSSVKSPVRTQAGQAFTHSVAAQSRMVSASPSSSGSRSAA